MVQQKGAVGDLGLWDELVGELYESVLNPGGLQDTVKRIDRWIGSSFCHLMAWDDRNDRHHFSILTDHSFLGEAAKYEQYYGSIDPRRQYSTHQPPGTVFACHDHFDDSFVSRDEFYQDLIIPMGARYILNACILRESGISAYIAFNHTSGHGHFSAEQKQAVTRLVPHMQRTLRIAMRNERFRAGLFAGEAGLDALEQAVFTVDANDGIIFLNRSAQALLKGQTWVKARGRQLVACAFGDAAKLSAVFARVRLSRQPETLALHGGSDVQRAPESTQLVTVLPVAPEQLVRPVSSVTGSLFDDARPDAGGDPASFPFVLGGAELVVLITPQRRKSTISAGSLKAVFGLTPAEARLAHELAKGVSVDEYSAAAAISVATARTQLRSILAKTGERRLQDLVRMLSTLPSRG
ncbi:hypothetical protein [Paraburkholderia unamae]|uniref:DNA-binding CsgD family transcriptional regulator n=1 Tax=Paraburkholderia unamae TaxID=219649 RepID=A0ABX5KG75_9BURK|nr:hypothetical protein [Paraburkholderia unamae]PVX77931.1 DNA-binding CsgD family transcriptional regulator [Paraburkholderia unamae]RAR58856.1 DNA-binding CsgD family transcriptional regulator [Paraburkholderia unamae]CAG9270690.1 putative HTH luxR-type domain-containing protein [Paraburkholderia unamae]